MLGQSSHVPDFMSLGIAIEIPKEGAQEHLMTAEF